MNNIAQQNMLAQQIRAWDVLDDKILNLLASLPRESFIPTAYKGWAYADMPTPLGHGQTTLAPKEEGKILQALNIHPTETVLEVGTGCGYLTALMAKQANHVYSVDILPEMTELARQHLAHHEIENITLETGDATHGWNKHAPYDVIVMTGSIPTLPTEFCKQLNPGGRILAILGDAPAMQVCLFTFEAKDKWQKKVLFETVTPRLANIKEQPIFTF